MFSKKVFGERLRLLRRQNHENQKKLADLLNVGQTQISDMESGKKTTTIEKLAVICDHYNVSADYLLGRSEEP